MLGEFVVGKCWIKRKCQDFSMCVWSVGFEGLGGGLSLCTLGRPNGNKKVALVYKTFWLNLGVGFDWRGLSQSPGS